MNWLQHYTHYFISTIILAVVSPIKTPAQDTPTNFVAASLTQLKQISLEMNQHALPLLALIQEYDKYGTQTTFKTAKVLKSTAKVRETDNSNSNVLLEVRLNEEFPVLDQQENWYKIKTKDNREGWILEEDIQLISRQLVEIRHDLDAKSRQESLIILAQMGRYKAKIDALYATAYARIKHVEESYKSLTREKKLALEDEFSQFQSYKLKIEKYYTYADQYFKPYEAIALDSEVRGKNKVNSGEHFKGTAMADFGRSNYRNMNTASTTSSRIGFNGVYQVDKFTQMNISLNHQNELIQTAFTNNMIESGISRQIGDKLVLGGHVNYNNYDDQFMEKNSFGHLRAGINADFNPGQKASFFGNVNYQSKKFKTANNNYEGILFLLGTNLMTNANSSIRILIQGNSQNSKMDYLNFNQISPQIIYTIKKSPVKSFSIGFDYDLLKHGLINSFNSYQKYRADLLWRNNRSKKSLSKGLNLTYKQYPNNSTQDYFRLAYTLTRRKGSLQDQRSSVSSFSPVLTIVTDRENNSLTDYLDLRWDRSVNKPKGFLTTNIYSRLWNNFEKMLADTSTFPDHYVDFYTEFGPSLHNLSQGAFQFSGLKIGFIFGGHVYFNADEDHFLRNGNSIRGGIGLTTIFKILKAHLELAGSYEHSWILVKEMLFDPVTGDVSSGENLLRDPFSFQYRIDFRLPLYQNWDIHFNLSSYDIRTDATTETSINPVERKSNMRFFGGLIYRFAL